RTVHRLRRLCGHQRSAAACAIANARPAQWQNCNVWRARPPLARPLLHAAASVCDRWWHARPPLAQPLLHTTASTCDRRLMRLPSSLDRLAIGSVVDAADLYAHSTRRYSSASTIALVDSRDLIRWNCRLAVRSYTRLAALRQAPLRIAKVVADVAELTSRADVILRLTWLGRLDGPNIYPIILSPLPEEVLHEVSRGGVLDDFTTRGSVAPWLGLLHLLWELV
ncbi:hypothetical protein BHM03_00060136, partial [Ensete ventricosum]